MEVNNWRSQPGVKAGRAGTLRAIRLRVEKELTRYLETAESDKRVKGRVLHLAKRYEKKQWLAAVSARDYCELILKDLEALAIEVLRDVRVTCAHAWTWNGPPPTEVQRVSGHSPLTPSPSNPCPLPLPTPPSPALQAERGQVAGMRTGEHAMCNPGHALPTTDAQDCGSASHLLSNLRICSG